MKKFFIFAALFFFGFSVFCENLEFSVKGLVTESANPVELECEWKDEWFSNGSAFSYNHKIARIAAILATVSYTDVEDFPDTNLMRESYKTLGIKDSGMEFHYDLDYSVPTLGDNQAAFSFASKKLKQASNSENRIKNLVFVVIRGTPLNANEWISNLAISDSTKQNSIIHEGFYKTMQQVHSALIYYLLKQKIDPDETSFLITGHSRGAAVANLLGATLSNEKIFDTSKIFTYTFASPNVSQEDDISAPKYNFIWNIVNGEDIVPTVPPNRNSWKFGKYGKTLTLVNRWTCDKKIYDDDYYPKMNEIYSKFLLRSYCPFKNGTFVPSQISRVLTGIYPDVTSYYNGKFKLRNTAEKIMWKVFPPSSEEINEQVENQKQSLFKNISSKINSQTEGLVDYVKNAFVDMHASETYLSWLLSLGENEAFSNLGSIQLVLSGYYECAVFDMQGNLLARIIDGIPQYKDIKVPIAAMPLPSKKTAVGFPLNEDFEVVIYKPSLVPTRISAKIEDYDAQGHLIFTEEKQNFYPRSGLALTFKAGKILNTNYELEISKIKGKNLKEKVESGSLRQEDIFRFKPEFSMDIDQNLNFGATFGTKMIYGSALLSEKTGHFGDSLSIAPGIGHQNYLYGNIMFNSEIFGRCVWIFDEKQRNDGEKFSFIPEARFSVSFQPFHHFEIFAAGVFDFSIDGFNDGYFESKIQKNKIGKINISDSLKIVPTICFGVKL